MPTTLQFPRETSCGNHLILSFVSCIITTGGSSFSMLNFGFLRTLKKIKQLLIERFSLKIIDPSPPWNPSRMALSRITLCQEAPRGFWGTIFYTLPYYIQFVSDSYSHTIVVTISSSLLSTGIGVTRGYVGPLEPSWRAGMTSMCTVGARVQALVKMQWWQLSLLYFISFKTSCECCLLWGTWGHLHQPDLCFIEAF